MSRPNPYGEPEYQNQYPGQYQDQYQGQYQGQQYQEPPAQKGLIAGRLDGKSLAANIGITALLGGVITGALVWLVDAIVTSLTGYANDTLSAAVGWALLCIVFAIIGGALAIPAYMTSNTGLFKAAVVAIGAVAIVVRVFMGGLLDGDWNSLIELTGIACTVAVVNTVPGRVRAADVYV
ncbi:hypothetical protein KRX51_00445 [Corynebacterium sp. TAE3-ERU12]|uniref:hypothetical protein n=1 Tax=Corynebacterium sp. TAE3-ERU12 TaxID=2849491 RepID=UPI001C45D85A|nr:hypothetical protein [Corynebacterium sp. TAE3-ERU12]MBV7294393.1 hypothetical protein [Corynebacterium sp. TAE3-ERU12]